MRDVLAGELSARFAAVTPRSVHGVIHGELGPDHVMVDDVGIPVLIDIEGTEIAAGNVERVLSAVPAA